MSKDNFKNQNILLEKRLREIPKEIVKEESEIKKINDEILEKEKDIEIAKYQIKNIDLLINELQKEYSDIAEDFSQFIDEDIAPFKVQE